MLYAYLLLGNYVVAFKCNNIYTKKDKNLMYPFNALNFYLFHYIIFYFKSPFTTISTAPVSGHIISP